MATAELNENSTSEEIQATVDQIEKDYLEEASEEKGDARVIVDNAKNQDGPKETPVAEDIAGNEETVDERVDDPKSDEDTGEGWLNDDLKAEMAAYGVGEEELASFTSREELERARRFFDQAALKAYEKSKEEPEEPQVEEKTGRVRGEDGRFQKAPSEPKEGQYEVGLSDMWDEDAKAELTQQLTGIRDHYESRIAAIEERVGQSEARFAEADAIAKEERFDAAVDAIGNSELFGKTGKESPSQLKHRKDLLPYVEGLELSLGRVGVELTHNQLVMRAYKAAFPDDFLKKELKARTKKISEQADGKMDGASTRGPEVPEDPRDEADRMYRQMAGL